MTWRLYGSLPNGVKPFATATAGQRFVELDEALHSQEAGPLWLKEARIAQLVQDAFLYGEEVLRLYDLEAWVIFANHVHLLIRPHVELARITRVLKSYTANRANQLLGRRGRPLWQIGSFDRVRSAAEFEKIVRYIENNPLKAGLVTRPEEWKWSSAGRKKQA